MLPPGAREQLLHGLLIMAAAGTGARSKFDGYDARTRQLLQDARGASPLTLCFRLDKLPRTVLPRLMRQPLVWITFLCYAVLAALARSGVHAPEFEPNFSLSQLGVLVTFVVVFYVGCVPCLALCGRPLTSTRGLAWPAGTATTGTSSSTSRR